MKTILHTTLLAASLTVTTVGEVFAAGASHGEKASSGLPQMDPTWFPSQLFWLAITFVVLYVIFSKKVLPELSSIIESRREHIQGDLDNASSLKEEADKVHQAYNEILEDARQKSTSVFIETDEQIKERTENEYKSFEDRAQKETDVFEKRIEKAKIEAMGDMDAIAAEIAAEAAERIVGIATDIKDAKNVVKNVNKQNKKAA